MRKIRPFFPVHAFGLVALSLFFHQTPTFEAGAAAEEAPDARRAAVEVAEVVLQAHFEVTSVVEVVAGEGALEAEDVRGTFGGVELKVDVKRQRALARVTGKEGEREFLILLKRLPKKAQDKKPMIA